MSACCPGLVQTGEARVKSEPSPRLPLCTLVPTVLYLSALMGPPVCSSIALSGVQTLCTVRALEVLASLIHPALESWACVHPNVRGGTSRPWLLEPAPLTWTWNHPKDSAPTCRARDSHATSDPFAAAPVFPATAKLAT